MNGFRLQLEKILQEEVNRANKCIVSAREEMAKKGVKLLKKNSPRRPGTRPMKYSKNWTYEEEGNSTWIRNKEYRLTHLLEKGHQIIKNGKSVGRAKAIPHIEPVEKQITKEFYDKVVEELENG